MAITSPLNLVKLRAYNKIFSTTYEDEAIQARGEFLHAFPLKTLGKLELEDYVIGRQAPTFCTFLEVKTRSWASIYGATALKFGIYFGETKSDKTKKYRFSKKFGSTQSEAYEAVKGALRDLGKLASNSSISFEAIDSNPLSQMLKAKVLSLYFPDKFLNVCSKDHLETLAAELGMEPGIALSEIQHRLMDVKNGNSMTKHWSNPKFMSFLYVEYINLDEVDTEDDGVVSPRKKAKRRVNFEEVQKLRSEIGEAAELFALEWEKQRLLGAGLGNLVAKIDDRRDRPAYGYDYLSHSGDGQERYVEVKAVGCLRGGDGHRFFLSDNEHVVSVSRDHAPGYFFYLVFFDGKSKPERVVAMPAAEMYARGEMMPAAYVLRFDLGISGD
ncbi:DUF3883 domain-containing protein [Variovorax ureilyticus]|uniref:DUF3883 domain-containing protein n=1 Tax=Variovorax ureilyticus TaxID=1836198 RepID=A0ABU8VTD8_9BURK